MFSLLVCVTKFVGVNNLLSFGPNRKRHSADEEGPNISYFSIHIQQSYVHFTCELCGYLLTCDCSTSFDCRGKRLCTHINVTYMT